MDEQAKRWYEAIVGVPVDDIDEVEEDEDDEEVDDDEDEEIDEDEIEDEVEDEDEDEDTVECEQCLADIHLYDAGRLDESFYCGGCYDSAVEEVQAEAEEFANEYSEIVSPLVRGLKAHNRHCHTNYEWLIRGLRRDSDVDQIRYYAIRERVNRLIEEAGPEEYEGYEAGQNWALDAAEREALGRLVACGGKVSERRTASGRGRAARDLHECLYPDIRDDQALEDFWLKAGWTLSAVAKLPPDSFVFDFIEGALEGADELAVAVR